MADMKSFGLFSIGIATGIQFPEGYSKIIITFILCLIGSFFVLLDILNDRERGKNEGM